MPRKPNFMIVITDQQSGHPYWPEAWEEKNLPAMSWLRENGISFDRAYTNSCTCSPARVTMLTGLYPAQHGVTEVLEFDNISRFAEDVTPGQGTAQAVSLNIKERRQRGMPSNIQNLAKILKTAGYNVIYKGKWHLTKPANWVRDPEKGIDQKYWTRADVKQIAERYGFDGWTMPDAGDNLKIENMGAGSTKNDQRFIDGRGQAAKYGDVPYEVLEPESVVHFLHTYDSDKPFCLIVSLVNPHDVLAYPGTGGNNTTPLYQAAGYKDEDFQHLPIDRPPTWNEDLSTKPRSQAQFRAVSNQGGGQITADDTDLQLGYCRFYAYLCKHIDHQIMEVLEALKRSPHFDDTVVVRISDHGDMAMSHGLQRQKMFNMYEETLNVPFVISNPNLFKHCRGAQTDSLVSLIDLLPTLANLAGVPDLDRWVFKGKDLSPILSDPRAEVQNHIHFTYEDMYFFVSAAAHIRAIVEKRWKYAVYFDIFTDRPFEYEMYDLAVPRDEREVRNLGHPDTKVSPEVAAERERLHQKLIHIMQTLGTLPHEIEWPEHWGEQRPGERA
ncbi:MAG TPA: sulfatase-like hydrolase/transferase [Thermoanaerobaculia bacterium]|nr:sulfatase-like hydrolase/transferase [Thermoanaerobaculia bacterium]